MPVRNEHIFANMHDVHARTERNIARLREKLMQERQDEIEASKFRYW
jgi:hypothetical protein